MTERRNWCSEHGEVPSRHLLYVDTGTCARPTGRCPICHAELVNCTAKDIPLPLPEDPIVAEFWARGFDADQCAILADAYRKMAAAGMRPSVTAIAQAIRSGA